MASPSPQDFFSASKLAYANAPDPATLHLLLDQAASSGSPDLATWTPLLISSQVSPAYAQDGMYADAFLTGTGQVVIAFEGTASSEQVRADGHIVLQSNEQALTDAEKFTTQVISLAHNIPIQVFVTGHSLGGLEAEYVDWQSRLPGSGPLAGGVTFGAPGVPGYGPGVQGYVNPDPSLIDYVDRRDPVGNYATDTFSLVPNTYHVGTLAPLASGGGLLLGGILGLGFYHPTENYAKDLGKSVPPTTAGFDGDQVSLSVYDPDIAPNDLLAYGTATIAAGTVPFPSSLFTSIAAPTFSSVANLSTGKAPPGVALADPSVTFNGDQIVLSYPASQEGVQFTAGTFNGFVFQTAAADQPVTGVSLASTNIPGLTSSDLTFTDHSIQLNEAGLTLPPNAAGSIVLTATFGQSSQSNTFLLLDGQRFSTSAPNAAVIGTGDNAVFLGGSGDTFSGDGNAVVIVSGNSTVWTNGGSFASEGITGSGNIVGLGAPIDLVWDQSAGGNGIIPRAGAIELIGGPGIQNDMLNLSNILGATQWNGSGSTLLDYLHIVPTGAPEWPAAIGYSTTPNGPFQLAAFVENMTPQEIAAHVGVL